MSDLLHPWPGVTIALLEAAAMLRRSDLLKNVL
jgi:hypothetical protein